MPGAEEPETPTRAERELAEDAQWKRIQQNTFTRWCNQHLKSVGEYIYDLETDLADGLLLIHLIQNLSQKRIPRYNKRPTFRSQKLENVAVVLQFIQEEERIKLVNIDASDIVDSQLKLILGLIWTLILHYSISRPMWDDEGAVNGADVRNAGDMPTETPKQRLMNWIHAKLPGMPVHNFTSDWQDGRTLGALVDAVAPGLCPDWPAWRTDDGLRNTTEAMDLADEWLSVPKLIEPHEMIDPKVDDRSVMTYLSNYPTAKLQDGAPLRSRSDPTKVQASGPGLSREGIRQGRETFFRVDTFNAGRAPVEVKVLNAMGELEPAQIVSDDDREKTFTVNYIPRTSGPHKVVISYAGQEIPNSPYIVGVEAVQQTDISKVSASGPGLESGTIAGSTARFTISAYGAGPGSPGVTVIDPMGHVGEVKAVIREDVVGGDDYQVEYIPTHPGKHIIEVTYAGEDIPGSPFHVDIKPAIDLRKVRAYGRGLQPLGVRIGDKADFFVTMDGNFPEEADVKVIGPSGKHERVNRSRMDDGMLYYTYDPVDIGEYQVLVLVDGDAIVGSPFKVNVDPPSESKIRAFGPGLESGIVNLPCNFTVDTNGETGELGFSIEGPSQATIKCHDNEDGTAEISYVPTHTGQYAIHITCSGDDIPNSPYMADIVPFVEGIRPSMVRCTGPGLEQHGVIVDEPTEFRVDAQAAGKAPLKVYALDKEYDSVPIKVLDKGENVYDCFYEPTKAFLHNIVVSYAGVAVAGSPFRVMVEEPLDPSKVRVYGPGLEPGVVTAKPTHFVVNCKQAGPGDVGLVLTDGKGIPHEVTLIDNNDGTFTGRYMPPKPGVYRLQVLFCGREIPESPVEVVVKPHVNLDDVSVKNFDTRVFIDSTSEFLVDAKSLSKIGGDKVKCFVEAPSGRLLEAPVMDNKDGTYLVSYSPFEEGPYRIDVTYEGVSVPGMPETVMAEAGYDATRCKAYGPGLDRGIVDESNRFTIETKGAGTAGLGLSIEGPSEARMNCTDNYDGTCLVEYFPVEAGEYSIGIKFAEDHIPGSPFKVPVEHDIDATAVTAYGPGLQSTNCRANLPLRFTVDASKSGPAPLSVTAKAEKDGFEPHIQPEIVDRAEGLYDVTYYAPDEGQWMTLKVTYGGKDISDSPYRMYVLPQVEPGKVRVFGEGVTPVDPIPASIPQSFSVDAREAGVGDLDVAVMGPDNEPLPCHVGDNEDGTYDVKYTPVDIGRHSLALKYGSVELPMSPYSLSVVPTGDASKCYIMEGIDDVIVINREQCITVNHADAGPGNVTVKIRPVRDHTTLLSPDVEKNPDDTTSIYFMPLALGPHFIELKYGGQVIPRGEIETMVESTEPSIARDTATLVGAGVGSEQRAQTFPLDLPPVEFWNIQVPLGSAPDSIIAEVVMPTQKKDHPTIKENADGSVTVKYQPHQKGLHEMHIKHQGLHVQGSPFQFHVDSVSGGYVTAYGSGLIYGTAGEPATFTVAAHEAHGGGLSISVEGPAKADIKCHDNKDGTVSVNWSPPAPGEYKIYVKYADKNINGSPFTARISGEGRKRSHISVGSTSEVSLKISEDVKGLSASIKSPSGIEEPCFIRKLDEGHLGISFTPREVGEHLVAVKKRGTLLPNAPFRIHVGEQEVGNAEKVKISGPGVRQAITQQFNEFTVDTRNAGFGGLSISVEGPSKCEIQCKDNKDGTCNILYKPTEPGIYLASVKFADQHVTGSPFTVKCEGAGIGTVAETFKSKRHPVSVVNAGQDCELHLKIPGADALDIGAKLMTPEGKVEDIEISEVTRELFVARFKPSESGLHTVSVIHKGGHISGSPFQFTVGSLKDGGSHKVRAGGAGLVRGEVNFPSCFNIYCREAGAGNLSLAIEGPSKAEIDFKDHKDGNCYVTYKVSKPGEYACSIKWDDKHIPDSPFRVFVSPSSGEARKLELASFPTLGLQLDKPVTFTVLTHGAQGHIDAKVVSPAGAEDDCFITPIDEGESYAVRFIPHEAGNHYVHVKLDGTHMRDSPFRVRVGGKEESDPTAVTAGGAGLKNVETGQKSEFIINTCNAGAGTLQVSVDGPSKVTLDAYEVDVGYKVRYTPLAPGDYFITLKYNGVHVPGSPFKVLCTGTKIGGSGYNETSAVQIDAVEKSGKGVALSHAPKFKGDASKVTCKGMGLKKAHVGRQNMFNVDASQSGNDVLTVSVYTKDGPGDEVHIKHQGRGAYAVNYLVKKRGTTAYIYVLYGGKHIPGSPFVVET